MVSMAQNAVALGYHDPSMQILEDLNTSVKPHVQIEGSTIWKDADSTSSLQQIQLHSSSKSQVSSDDP
ncbi:unnamed protein product [Didymodactylos carnosus]|uniref:Uncharacterized protein n=1 Tax=Didymodactylos carnosus TaxID=1234261 RepID=A0A8S2KQW1_9BILA|nr:unnamed protein product [Didymodactylos carnosus]CAF3862345.1 unnamed protein product [Didymodactylos carnosus]